MNSTSASHGSSLASASSASPAIISSSREQGLEQVRLLGEAAVDGPDADPGAGRDRVHRHAHAALGELGGGSVEDPPAVALGVGAQGPVGSFP